MIDYKRFIIRKFLREFFRKAAPKVIRHAATEVGMRQPPAGTRKGFLSLVGRILVEKKGKEGGGRDLIVQEISFQQRD